MAYGLKIAKLPKDEIDRRVREAAALLELTDFLARKPRQLSGGQRQRVAMGRAIVREPSVFLFDEPLSNLDAKLRTQMRVEIRRLQQRLRITSLYVTHDQVEAMTLGDRLLVLNAGEAEQIGTPMEVYEQAGEPVRRRLHRLAGDELPAGRGRSGRQARHPGGAHRVASAKASGNAGRHVVAGIRPEHLRPATEADGERRPGPGGSS